MIKQLELVKEFHEKFKGPILEKPSLIPQDRYKLRHSLMDEEVQEYLEGNQNKDLENISKEICDILYALYGTILEHGLQDKIEELFLEVHKSHMSKDYSEYKMIKGDNYFKPDLKPILKEYL